MRTPSIVVFEKHPRWCPELQRQFSGEPVDVCGCSRPTDFERRFWNGSVGVMDVDAAPQECLQLISQFGRHGEFPPLIAIGSVTTAALEWPLREFGVLEFALERPLGADLARLCRRQWSVRPNPAVHSSVGEVRTAAGD